MDKTLQFAIPAAIATCGVVAGWMGKAFHTKRKENRRRRRANVTNINRGEQEEAAKAS